MKRKEKPNSLNVPAEPVIEAMLDVLAQAAIWLQTHERAQAKLEEPSSWAPSTDKIMRNNKTIVYLVTKCWVVCYIAI